MPYIKMERKNPLYNENALPENVGELNFCLTTELLEYLQGHGLSYQTINDCLGALEGCKLEFYRRVAAPYEDKKIKENGDVYD